MVHSDFVPLEMIVNVPLKKISVLAKKVKKNITVEKLSHENPIYIINMFPVFFYKHIVVCWEDEGGWDEVQVQIPS